MGWKGKLEDDAGKGKRNQNAKGSSLKGQKKKPRAGQRRGV